MVQSSEAAQAFEDGDLTATEVVQAYVDKTLTGLIKMNAARL